MMAGFSAILLALSNWVGDHPAPIATFTAALVALFKEDFVKGWRHPKLTLQLRLGPPDSNAIWSIVEWPDPSGVQRWEGEIFYFRFWIENTGSWPAERVEVNLRSIHSDEFAMGALACK
jgi:hypothetical protein